jgi:ribosomal protein S18 acetylase RimI-like enzyme
VIGSEDAASPRLAQASDVAAIADLHRSTFPHYESSRLGAAFTRRLLGAYLDHPRATILVVGEVESAPHGYLVGCPPSTQRQINEALVGAAAQASIGMVLRDPRQAAGRLGPLWRRGHRVVTSRQTGTRRDRPTAPSHGDQTPTADQRVVLIGVDHRRRGRGVADALLSGFRDWASGEGATTADLVVEGDNVGARTCYERNGWTPGRRETGTDGFVSTVRYHLAV